MEHYSCTLSDLEIDFREIYRSMGYQNEKPDIDVQLLVEKVYEEIQKICILQYMYKIYEGGVQDHVSIAIGNQHFKTGRMITSYLTDGDEMCVFVTTAGQQYDDYKMQARKDGDLVKEFIADAIGSVIAEACVSKIEKRLYEVSSKEHTYPYSPGYCGWKLTEQRVLFSLLPDSPCGIALTDSCLMLPIKSISGIIGLGKEIKRRAYGCSICENINCYKRKEQ